MSIFGSIMRKILGHDAAAAPAPVAATGNPFDASAAATPAAATPATAAPAASAPAPSAPVDVGAMLADLAAKSGRPSNYKVSIVDLMTLLGLDSSFANRKALAEELHYTGDTNDSASMNIWLHKTVMQKLAENGGNVPAELRG